MTAPTALAIVGQTHLDLREKRTMAAELPLGLETVSVAGSADVPAYRVPIDKDGVCTAPATAAAAVTAAGGATDVFLLSHGWNNDSLDARSRYLGWISQLLAVRPAVGPGADGFRPVFVGVFWPSMIAPSPAGALPQLAGAPVADASTAAIVDELGDRIGQADADWLTQALTRANLPDSDATRAAALLLPLFAGEDTELAGAALGPQTSPLPRSLLGRHRPLRAFVGRVEPTFSWTLRGELTEAAAHRRPGAERLPAPVRRRSGGNGDAALLSAHLAAVAALSEEQRPTAKRWARRAWPPAGARSYNKVSSFDRAGPGDPRRPGGGDPEASSGLIGRRPASR